MESGGYMNKTNIEYLTHTWNPIVMRCNKVSPACDNCWHLAMCERFAKNPMFPEWKRGIYAGKSTPQIDKKEIDAPLKRVAASVIGVQFMGDLFHDDVADWMLDGIFDRIFYNGISHHTFIILTKRPERMRDYLSQDHFSGCNDWANVWLGVTVENQEMADRRIPELLVIPAVRHFISVEPMLNPVFLRDEWMTIMNLHSINWVIAGCESGPGARTMQTEWARSLKDQCVDAGVPFFLKQMMVAGKLVKMPELDGQVWDQMPEIKR